jgi:hypothetical protein
MPRMFSAKLERWALAEDGVDEGDVILRPVGGGERVDEELPIGFRGVGIGCDFLGVASVPSGTLESAIAVDCGGGTRGGRGRRGSEQPELYARFVIVRYRTWARIGRMRMALEALPWPCACCQTA